MSSHPLPVGPRTTLWQALAIQSRVVGAMILRVISFYFRILSIDPLLQPLVEGVVLLSAVSLGAIRVLRVKNRLDLFR